MFIRRTTTRRSDSGEAYYTYRLVESQRQGDRVRQVTVSLYDLTNSYFEGLEAGNPKARRGHSKEKRSDWSMRRPAKSAITAIRRAGRKRRRVSTGAFASASRPGWRS